jgi:tetratricopeptide (TPR) repeat protein
MYQGSVLPRAAFAFLLAASPVLCADTALQQKERFDIRGVVELARGLDAGAARSGRFASLRLSTPSSPYTAAAQSDPVTGQFRFKKVPEGTYVLDAFGRAGSARYLVNVSREAAGESRTVRMTVRLRIRPGELKSHLKRRFEVSYRTLSIPDKARAEYDAAVKRIQKEDYGGAVERLEKAVAIAPQFSAAWNRLGFIAFFQKRLPDAERYFRGAVENDPDAWDARLRLGQVLLMQGKPDQALVVTETAVKLRPTDATARSQLAMTYVELKEYDKAIPHLAEASRIDPRHPAEPQLWLARIYVAQKKYTAAVHEVEEYLQTHPRGQAAEELRNWLRQLKPGEQRE